MSLHNGSRDVQTEADSASIVLGDLNEAIENGFQLVVGDTRSCVAHGEAHVSTNIFDMHHNCAAGRSELERVAQQIGEHLEAARDQTQRWRTAAQSLSVTRRHLRLLAAEKSPQPRARRALGLRPRPPPQACRRECSRRPRGLRPSGSSERPSVEYAERPSAPAPRDGPATRLPR